MSSSDVDASDHSGWSSENDPWGSSGGDIGWGGGLGNGNSGDHGGNSGSNKPSVTAMAFGFPQPLLAGPTASVLNLTFSLEHCLRRWLRYWQGCMDQ